MLRLLSSIRLFALFVLLTGCAHKKTCSFRLDIIGDIPSDIKSYSIIEVDSVELLPMVFWGIELYSDALTNVNSMALTTKESLRMYRQFLKNLKGFGLEKLEYEMESVMQGEKNHLPKLDVQALLQDCAFADCSNSNSFENMDSLSKDLSVWILTLKKHTWTLEEYDSAPMLSNLEAMYRSGGIEDILWGDYWNESKKKQRLQSIAYACVLSEKYPLVKRLYVDEHYKKRSVVMEHGRAPLPVRVDVVGERKFVFKDWNRNPFAELTMCFDYGYYGYFKEVNMDSKMVLDMAFRVMLQGRDKGSSINGDIRHNLETGEVEVDVR